MKEVISFIFRFLIGGIFVASGLAKIADPVRFILTLREFRLFPEVIIPFTALYLPWLEFILGLCILLGLMYRSASLMLGVLTGIFTLAIASVIVRGIEIDCGCFGMLADILHLPDFADYRAVIRNIIFTVMCAYIATAKKTIFSLEQYFSKIPVKE